MIRERLTYANVMATLAFFVAVGGVGWAAATIDSGDVVDNSLNSKDLRNDKGVKSADVPLNALTGEDIDETSLDNVDADRLIGINGDTFARGNARRRATGTGFSLTPVVVSDAVGAFQLLCNNPDVEPSQLRFFAPASGVPGAGDRDSWVTLDDGPLSYENLLTDLALPEHHDVVLDPSVEENHRVVWQVSPEVAASGEIVTAIFSFHQADTTNAPCDILGQAAVAFAS